MILVFCVVGSFALKNRMFDVWTMLAFGLVGFGMERLKIPLAPFVIGFVLSPLAEENLGAGLMLSDGSLLPIVTRPLSLLFFTVAVVMAIVPVWRRFRPQSTGLQIAQVKPTTAIDVADHARIKSSRREAGDRHRVSHSSPIA